MCSDAVFGSLVAWQRDRASLNVRVHTWAEQLDKYILLLHNSILLQIITAYCYTLLRNDIITLSLHFVTYHYIFIITYYYVLLHIITHYYKIIITYYYIIDTHYYCYCFLLSYVITKSLLHIITFLYYCPLLHHYYVLLNIQYYSLLHIHSYISITSVLHQYYVIIMSSLQMTKLCYNDFIITYNCIGCFYHNYIITHYYPLLPIIMYLSLSNLQMDIYLIAAGLDGVPVAAIWPRVNSTSDILLGLDWMETRQMQRLDWPQGRLLA